MLRQRLLWALVTDIYAEAAQQRGINFINLMEI